MIKITIANGLKQQPKDYDFALFPNIIFSRPPDDMIYINRNKSFAFAIEWGHWDVVLWFIKVKDEL